jgi:hypothetical protein
LRDVRRVIQGPGIIGLSGLVKLRLLNVVGNKDLDPEDVLCGLLGGQGKRAKALEEYGETPTEPLHNLEALYLGLPTKKVRVLTALVPPFHRR